MFYIDDDNQYRFMIVMIGRGSCNEVSFCQPCLGDLMTYTNCTCTASDDAIGKSFCVPNVSVFFNEEDGQIRLGIAYLMNLDIVRVMIVNSV